MGKVRGRRVKKDEEDFQEEPVVEEVATKETQAFFGLVDSSELTYFHQAEQTLNLNTFQTPLERQMFVQSVFEEARGKELKLVTNQICSKLMERLILDSSLHQMIQLSNAFTGKFVELSKQKYSSHVLESYIVRMAALVEREIISKGVNADNKYTEEDGEGYGEEEDEEDFNVELKFLSMIDEFVPKIKSMMKDKYASHVLRLTLLVLSGKELPSSVASNSILRSKKSKIARKMIEIKDNENYKRQFQTPSSFRPKLKPIVDSIFADEDAKSLRELAIEPIASPVIQLIIQLEGLVDKNKPFWSTIFNGDKSEEAFVEYILSDNVGSHFLQTSIQQQKLKNVERIYEMYMKDRIVKLAKRETTGVYVVEAMMEKLKEKEQQEILHSLVPVLNELIVNNLEIGGKIIECSKANGDFLKPEIVEKLLEFFNKGNDGDLLENVLKYKGSTLFSTKDDWPTSEERRRAIFLETLMEYDDKILVQCTDSIINLSRDTLSLFCKHGVFSHIIEKVLVVGADKLSMFDKKGMLNNLVPLVVDLACNSTGSHIVDKLWQFTFKLNMFKERIAKAMFDNREQLKSTLYGKMVWKNWQMELYARKFNDWKRIVKDEEYAAKDATAASGEPALDAENSNKSQKRPNNSQNQRGEFKKSRRYK